MSSMCVQSYGGILYPTIHLRNTQCTDHMSSTYSPGHHSVLYPTIHGYINSDITDHMSSTYSPVHVYWDGGIHLRNTRHWPHVQYVQWDQYRSHRTVRTGHVVSPVCFVSPLGGTNILTRTVRTGHVVSPTIHLRNTHHCVSYRYMVGS